MSPDLRIRFVEPLSAIALPGRSFRAVHRKPEHSAPQDSKGRQNRSDQTRSEEHPEDPESERSREAPPGTLVEKVAPAPSGAISGKQVMNPEVTPDWAVAQGRFEELMRRIETEVSHLEQRFAEEIRRLEPQLVRLSLAVTAKLLGQAMADGSVDLAGLIRDGLTRITSSMREPKQITIRVGADHKAAVEEVLKERQDAPGSIRVEVDREFKPFTCEIHCDMRQVSIDLERELERIGDALLGGGQKDG